MVKPTLKVRIFGNDFLDDFDTCQNKKYYKMPRKQLIQTFLPKNFNYEIVPIQEKADICLCGIQTTSSTNLRPDELNF